MDPGEACDDGNLLDLDGCSSGCKVKCEDCLDRFYGDDPDYQYLVDQYRNLMEVSTEGPAPGVPRSKLAQNLLTCIVQSDCILEESRPFNGCYCGGVSNTDCDAGKAMGPCIGEFGNAAEGREPAIVADRLSNTTLGVGIAVELAKLQGNFGYCVEACREDRDVTPCEVCLAGPDTGMLIQTVGCTACLLPGVCYPDLLECAERECADGNMVPCLGNHPSTPDDTAKAGPCKDVAIASLQGFGPTADYLRCKTSQCKAECYAP